MTSFLVRIILGGLLTPVFTAPSQHQLSRHAQVTEIRQMEGLRPIATFQVGGDPDWMAVADDAVWVTASSLNRVTRLDATANSPVIFATVQDPCSGIVAAFGSLWVPSCVDHALLRVDLKTGVVQTSIAASPADSEGCIAAGAGSIWLVTNATGLLARVDPRTSSVVATIPLPSGSYCPVFADGFVWVTSFDHSVLTKVDPSTNRSVAQISVGQNPRFATAGAGSVWTLNQGDGTISRVDTATSALTVSIPTGLRGHGGEIAFGFGSVWATLIGVPITRVDPSTNRAVRQWRGAGGDSIRAGLGSIWLTDIKAGLVWRLDPQNL